MALVTGPLHSDDASGTFAGALTFSKWNGRKYVRQRVDPKNPKSAKQLGVRAMMKFLAKAWALIGSTPQGTWDEGALSRAISAFNQFASINLQRWQDFLAPTKSFPAAETSTPLTVTAHTFTGGVGQVNLSLTPSGATNIWGIAIFRDTAEITAPDWTKCIAIVPTDSADPVVYIDSPLAAGTYHYRAAVLNDDGVLGTVLADDTAVVT